MTSITISAEDITNAIEGRINLTSFDWSSYQGGHNKPSFEFEITEDIELEGLDVVDVVEFDRIKEELDALADDHEQLQQLHQHLGDRYDELKEEYEELCVLKEQLQTELNDLKTPIWRRWTKR